MSDPQRASIRFMLIAAILSLFAFTSFLRAQDSLHVRHPDSTAIVLDRETIPPAIRSRMHQISLRNPLGFIPREESGAAGYWNPGLRPQYGREIAIHGFPIRTRIRTSLPLRYFPQHSLIGLTLVESDTGTYPMRTRLLQRPFEPAVSVTYKKGDYALNGLSVNMAFDITDDTHIHLAREGNSYAGQYGIEGIQNQRYHLAAHHQVSDATGFLYHTLYTRDRNIWTAATPTPRRLGNEKTRWYHHLLRWRTVLQNASLEYGFRVGSHRLQMNGEPTVQHWTELQRGVWAGAESDPLRNLTLGLRYRLDEYHVQPGNSSVRRERWHHSRVTAAYDGSSLFIENHLTMLYPEGLSNQWFLLDDMNLRYVFNARWALFADLQKNVLFTPVQWKETGTYVTSPPEEGVTHITSAEIGTEAGPVLSTTVSGAAKYMEYQNWYRLSYQGAFDRTDSLTTMENFSGSLTLLEFSLDMKPFSWISLGGTAQWLPFQPPDLPEIWSALALTGYVHFSHYLFDKNLLLHLYAEGGMYSGREPVGWNPMLQSVTYYPSRPDPNPLMFAHGIAAGEIGPFTISVSFYNGLGRNMQYALDQRIQVPVFYLGVRWQFWN